MIKKILNGDVEEVRVRKNDGFFNIIELVNAIIVKSIKYK